MYEGSQEGKRKREGHVRGSLHDGPDGQKGLHPTSIPPEYACTRVRRMPYRYVVYGGHLA